MFLHTQKVWLCFLSSYCESKWLSFNWSTSRFWTSWARVVFHIAKLCRNSALTSRTNVKLMVLFHCCGQMFKSSSTGQNSWLHWHNAWPAASFPLFEINPNSKTPVFPTADNMFTLLASCQVHLTITTVPNSGQVTFLQPGILCKYRESFCVYSDCSTSNYHAIWEPWK